HMVERHGFFDGTVLGAGAGQMSAARERPDIRRCAAAPTPGPVPGEPERYLRQQRLPELGESGQRRLAGSRVAVIGAGGLGAPVLTYLAAAGIGEITLFDPDTVDATNLHR